MISNSRLPDLSCARCKLMNFIVFIICSQIKLFGWCLTVLIGWDPQRGAPLRLYLCVSGMDRAKSHLVKQYSATKLLHHCHPIHPPNMWRVMWGPHIGNAAPPWNPTKRGGGSPPERNPPHQATTTPHMLVHRFVINYITILLYLSWLLIKSCLGLGSSWPCDTNSSEPTWPSTWDSL